MSMLLFTEISNNPNENGITYAVDYTINHETQKGFLRIYDVNDEMWSSWTFGTSSQSISEVVSAYQRCNCPERSVAWGREEPGMCCNTLKGIQCENGCFNHIQFRY